MDAADQHGQSVTICDNPRKSAVSSAVSLAETTIETRRCLITKSRREVTKMKKIMTYSLVAISLAPVGLFSLPATNADSGNKPAPRNVTFTKDVAPIFFKSCAECHRAGEIAPFSVMSYKDARPWAKSIREKVASREMPPWH